jgi:CheY-like chemotaxis protein
MTTPAEGNNTQRRSNRILNWLYDFVQSYGLDFFSVVIAGTGLLLYEISSAITPEAIGRWTLLALLAISISNMGNRGTRIKEIQRMTKDSTTLVREHLDRAVLEENISRAIDEHLGKVDKCKTVGIVQIFEGFDSTQFRKRCQEAEKSVRILDAWTGQLDAIIGSLQEAASRGLDVQIILLKPNSPQAWYRIRDLFAFKDISPTEGGESIRRELARLDALHRENDPENKIRVRVYDAIPTASIYGFDDTNIVSTHWRRLSSMESTQLEVVVPARDLKPSLASAVHNHFMDLWDSAEELTHDILQAAESNAASSTPAVDALPRALVQGTEEFKDQPIRMREFVQRQARKLPELQKVMPAPDPLDLSGHQILWVDDHPINNALEVQTLKQLGIEIIQVQSTEEARKLLRKSHQMSRKAGRSKFDLIVSDLNRDEQDGTNPEAGRELFDHIQGDGDLSSHRHVPFIFYSDSVSNLDAGTKANVHGATDEANELINLVISAFRGRDLDQEAL